jgi:integrase/recombinase XerC
MQIADWPERDRKLWALAHAKGGLFDASGLAAHWRPSTLKACQRSYGIYLRWLAKNGLLDASGAPLDRVDRARLHAFMQEFGEGRADHTMAGAVRDVAYVLRACHPPDGLPWLVKLGHRLVNSARPAHSKLACMAPPSEIADLGDELMQTGRLQLASGVRSGAPTFRDGLAIGFLIRRPIRLGNLAALRVGHTLVRSDRGFEYRFSGEQTKTGILIEGGWPQDLVEQLEFYLADVRVVLIERGELDDEGWLWIGRRGRRMPDLDLSHRIGLQTLRHLGRRISPHRFRDCAATEIALRDPTHIGITKSVLSHSTLSTSQRYYNQARSFGAFARHQATIRKSRL